MRREITLSILTFLAIIVLLVGLVILALVLVKPSRAMAEIRDQQRLTDVARLEAAIQLYIADGKNFEDLSADQIFSSTNGSTEIHGRGWLPLNFSLSSGEPMRSLPVDPTNDSVYNYKIRINPANKTFEIDCRLEDPQNQARMANDQGNDKNLYEVGDDLTILK